MDRGESSSGSKRGGEEDRMGQRIYGVLGNELVDLKANKDVGGARAEQYSRGRGNQTRVQGNVEIQARTRMG